MNSFRRLIAVIIAIAIIFLFIITGISISHYRNTFNRIESINALINKYKQVSTEIEFPLRVLNNIITTIYNNEPIYTNRSDRFVNSYNNNYYVLTQDIIELIDAVEVLEIEVIALDRLRVLSNYSHILKEITSLKEYTHQLHAIILQLSFQEDSIQEKTQLIVEALEVHTNVKGSIEFIFEASDEIRTDVPTEYVLFNFGAFTILLIIIFVLAALNSKILYQNMPFLYNGFRMLHKHNCDVNELPPFNDLFEEERKLKSMVYDVISEQGIIDKIKEMSSSKYLLKDIIDNIFCIVQTAMEVDRIGVAFVDYNKEKIIAEHGVFKYDNVLLGPGFVVDFKETSLVELIKSKKSIIISSIHKEYIKKPHSRSLSLLKKEGVKSNMILPLIVNNVVIGFMFFSSIKENYFNEKTLSMGENIAYEISSIINKSYLTQRMFSNVTETFANIVDKRDSETGDHIRRMTNYSKVLALGLRNHSDEDYRVNQQFVDEIINNAAVHDIGKVGIPDNILNKPGKLDASEWEIMKTHTTIGYDVLLKLRDSLQIFNNDFYKTAIDIARHHHERWDGTGYPDGLSGLSIPLAARIVAIADVFDAISSKRVYKSPSSFEDTVKIINEGCGTHFDPELIKIFNESLDEFKKVYKGSDLF